MSVQTLNNLVDLSTISSKLKTNILTFYCFYNLQINFEDAQLPVGTIYSLSSTKQEALKKFINKNLNM